MTEKEFNKLLAEAMKLHRKGNQNIPARRIETSSEAISKKYATAYKKVFKELHGQLADNFGVLSSPSYQSHLTLMQLIEKRMTELDSVVAQVVKQELEESYVTAKLFHALASETIKDIEALKGAVPYSTLNTFKMEQIVQDTMDDLLFTTQHTSKELKKLVREVFSKNLQYHTLKEENQKEIKKIIEKELSRNGLKDSLNKKGFIGLVDKSGRKWSTKNYVDMAVKTKLNQAYVEGLKDRAVETGFDMAVIPEKGAKDSCRYFEGMLISLTGTAKGFPTYDSLQSTGLIFHPRCVHSPFPVGDISLLPQEDIDRHNEKVRGLKSVTAVKRKK